MRPLLIFPKPTNARRDPGSPRFSRPPKTSGHQRRIQRLTPKFDLLQQGLLTSQVQGTPLAIEPERTLVLITKDSVGGFANACSNIPGLEFISEELGDDLKPDDDFWIEDDEGNKKDTKIKSYVYMTMTNQEGLNQLLRYWHEYKQNESYKFPRGLTPLRDLFTYLDDIRYWDAEDRLRNTGLLEDWQNRIDHDQILLPAEVELWFRGDSRSRTSAHSQVNSIIQSMGGQVLSDCCISEIGYHALLVQIPANSVTELLQKQKHNIALLKCDDIFHFRPVGQCAAPLSAATESEPISQDVKITQEQDGSNTEPVVALLDGLPLQNHVWISNHIRIDDPDDWARGYTSSEQQQHGTAMASLIIHGDQNSKEEMLPQPLYVRPIMQADNSVWNPGQPNERVPETCLFVDLIHRSVKRIFEGEGGSQPAAPKIKIINLSIGDRSRPFDKAMSPLARLIDWLSYTYQVLFVISAGNYGLPIDLGVNNQEFAELSPEGKEALFIQALRKQMPYRRLLSPAESINAITVGALHQDTYDGEIYPNLIDLITTDNFPSPLNPLSWGKRRSIKPDILMPGGKIMYRSINYSNHREVKLTVKPSNNHPPGQKVAAPSSQPGNISGYIYSCGTSNAAAIASRRLAMLIATVRDLYYAEHGANLNATYEAVLLKAMLIHGAELHADIKTLDSHFLDISPQKRKAFLSRFTGYGSINTLRIHGCANNQATVLQCGEIKSDSKHVYELPLPACLNAKSFNRRLIITLAWLSPVNAKHNQYRQARLKFFPTVFKRQNSGALALETRTYDHNMIENGTVQHEILTGDRASAYSDNEALQIEIECTAAAGSDTINIPYGLVATLDSSKDDLPIYNQVKAGLDIRFKSVVTLNT